VTADLTTLSRRAWRDLETLHVLGYFAEEVTDAFTDLGLDRRLCYFPGRSAALGETGAGPVVATFYVFAPWLVEAALPAAWRACSLARLVAARRTGVRAALRRVLGEPDVDEALALARSVCDALPTAGRPLYAAHADLGWPDDDLTALWHAATLVREHRGDGHVAVRGELWQARAVRGELPRPGEEVEVVAVDGLSLVVEPLATRIPA